MFPSIRKYGHVGTLALLQLGKHLYQAVPKFLHFQLTKNPKSIHKAFTFVQVITASPSPISVLRTKARSGYPLKITAISVSINLQTFGIISVSVLPTRVPYRARAKYVSGLAGSKYLETLSPAGNLENHRKNVLRNVRCTPSNEFGSQCNAEWPLIPARSRGRLMMYKAKAFWVNLRTE